MPSDKTYENATILLDGEEYNRCTFRNCELQFGASSKVTLVNCSFEDIKWVFIDAAARTLDFMTGLYHEAGEGGKNLIEKTFENIRRKRHPRRD